MTKQEAIATFRALVARHGLQWNARVPAEDYARLAECNKVMSETDRRAALGLRV